MSEIMGLTEKGRQIRQLLEPKVSLLSNRIAIAMKNCADTPYRHLDMAILRAIADSVAVEMLGWIEKRETQVIERQLEETLRARLAQGYTFNDFMITNQLMQSECLTFCREILAEQPDLLQLCESRLNAVASIVRMINLQTVDKERQSKEMTRS